VVGLDLGETGDNALPAELDDQMRTEQCRRDLHR
jgi:hypothetical protein